MNAYGGGGYGQPNGQPISQQRRWYGQQCIQQGELTTEEKDGSSSVDVEANLCQAAKPRDISGLRQRGLISRCRTSISVHAFINLRHPQLYNTIQLVSASPMAGIAAAVPCSRGTNERAKVAGQTLQDQGQYTHPSIAPSTSYATDWSIATSNIDPRNGCLTPQQRFVPYMAQDAEYQYPNKTPNYNDAQHLSPDNRGLMNNTQDNVQPPVSPISGHGSHHQSPRDVPLDPMQTGRKRSFSEMSQSNDAFLPPNPYDSHNQSEVRVPIPANEQQMSDQQINDHHINEHHINDHHINEHHIDDHHINDQQINDQQINDQHSRGASETSLTAFHNNTVNDEGEYIVSPKVVTKPLKRGDPPTNADNKFICHWEEACEGLVFDRKCEWSKHMDKHDRPYRCPHDSCEKLQGFTYSGGLLRHEREVHGKHGGPKEQLMCPFPDCKRANGKGFTRKENLNEHVRRVHANKELPPSETSAVNPALDAMGGAEQQIDTPASKISETLENALEPSLSSKRRRIDNNCSGSESAEDLKKENEQLRVQNEACHQRIMELEAHNKEQDNRLRMLEDSLREHTQIQPQMSDPQFLAQQMTEQLQQGIQQGIEQETVVSEEKAV